MDINTKYILGDSSKTFLKPFANSTKYTSIEGKKSTLQMKISGNSSEFPTNYLTIQSYGT